MTADVDGVDDALGDGVDDRDAVVTEIADVRSLAVLTDLHASRQVADRNARRFVGNRVNERQRQLVTYACKPSGVSVKASGASRSAMVVRQRLARSTADTNSDVHQSSTTMLYLNR